MAYRLKPDESVFQSIKRIVKKQFRKAADELTDPDPADRDAAIHKARRSVKKIRAALRLMRPVLSEETYRGANERLREASRTLAPISDARATIEALDDLLTKHPDELTHQMLTPVRRALLERKQHADRRARITESLEELGADLRAQRKSVCEWGLKTDGFGAVALGLKKSFRQAEKAMKRARQRPTAQNYHRWRLRVKDQWYHLRLLEGICGRAIHPDKRRLEDLDAYLGEYHNLVLLRSAVAAEPEACGSRGESDVCLRLVAREQDALRRKASRIAARVYRETPRQFRRRMRHLWRAAQASPRGERQAA